MKRSAPDRVAQFVEDLLRGRRPRRFEASPEEAEAMSAAAGLAAARVGADLPDKEALERIHQRLSTRLNESPAMEDGRYSRRAWMRTFGTAAAATVLGVAIDQVVTRHGATGPVADIGPTVLTPDGGQWQTVAAVEQLPPGQAMAVTAGAVDAVVINDGGQISAVSGICTHLGCRLQPDNADKRLACPCHQTAFSWSGKVLFYRLKSAPADLPQVQSRVRDGQIELFVV